MEDFLSLGVTVKNKKNIYEGLEAFIEGDMLTEDNQYLCEKCDKKVDALKRVCIKKLPRYMIMTLKRFEFDFDQMVRVKVNDRFEFPLDLDMSEYT
jgi:ubiquitin C-terminal hydrolase